MTESDPGGDVVGRLRTVIATARPVVAGTSVGDDRPTPCAAWTVDELVGHMTATLAMFADGSPGQDGTFDEIADAVVAAWSDPGRLTGTVALPFGEVPAAFALEFPVLDVLVHSWDLARATGREVTWDPDTVAASLRFARANLAGPESRGPAFFPPVEPAPDDDPMTRLVRFLGRAG